MPRPTRFTSNVIIHLTWVITATLTFSCSTADQSEVSDFERDPFADVRTTQTLQTFSDSTRLTSPCNSPEVHNVARNQLAKAQRECQLRLQQVQSTGNSSSSVGQSAPTQGRIAPGSARCTTLTSSAVTEQGYTSHQPFSNKAAVYARDGINILTGGALGDSSTGGSIIEPYTVTEAAEICRVTSVVVLTVDVLTSPFE